MPALTAEMVKAQALSLGFDLCGICRPESYPELGFLAEWLKRGYAGDMSYIGRTRRVRRDVRHILPSAQSVIVTATNYNTPRPYSTEIADPGVARIARYAWGDDYHEVVLRRLNALWLWMRKTHPDPFEAMVYVDTGPIQERVYAQHAGIGWIGKHTCVISAKRGSWIFLSTILCSLPLDPDPPATDHCGTCTKCLDACPTGAIVEPYVLDARRCLSYLTIEQKKAIPAEHADAAGGLRLRLRHLPGRVPVEPGAPGVRGAAVDAAPRPRRAAARRPVAAAGRRARGDRGRHRDDARTARQPAPQPRDGARQRDRRRDARRARRRRRHVAADAGGAGRGCCRGSCPPSTRSVILPPCAPP